MASGSSSGTSATDDQTSNDDSPYNLEYYPLWQYMITLGKKSGEGGNKTVQCKLCMLMFEGSYSRVRRHLLKLGGGISACKKTTVAQLTHMSNLDEEGARRKENKTKAITLPRSRSSSSHSSSQSISMDVLSHVNESSASKRRKPVGEKSAIEKAFNLQVREQLDGEIARMFYSACFPFNLAKNPHFIRAFVFAVNHDMAGYIPPAYNSLRIKLLHKERTNVDNVLESIKSTWRTKGGQPTLNIFWTPCGVHTLNLALKDICAAKNTSANEITYAECNWITEVAGLALMIKNFIMNHSIRLAIFNEFSKLKLIAVAETRFASTIVMLKRFRLIKQQLQVMVCSDQWSYYRDDDVAKARLVRDILVDYKWWEKIDYILEFTDPIYSMLRFCDTNKPCLHLVYEMWDNMILQVKKHIFKHDELNDEDQCDFWNVVKRILEDRWSKSNNPLHCLAHSLNPR